MDPTVCVEINITPGMADKLEAQITAITLTDLLCRMTRNIRLEMPDVAVAEGLPWSGRSLRDLCKERTEELYPDGSQPPRDAVRVVKISIGGGEGDIIVHGAGWNAYVGKGPSPVLSVNDCNPVGPALAAIICAAHLFNQGLRVPKKDILLNAWNWRLGMATGVSLREAGDFDLGSIWFIGLGSVGSAAAYFLAMATRRFKPLLVDHDIVNIENLSRSPLFKSRHTGDFKVAAVEEFFREVGIHGTASDAKPFFESIALDRPRPQLIVSAANEMNVRHAIEAMRPPLQIYGTTGPNYQAAMIRHIPLEEACSCCLFPEKDQPKTKCATAPDEAPAEVEVKVDAALPFLSFAAGLMAVAEILKSQIPGFPFHTNRVIMNTFDEIFFQHAEIPKLPGCACGLLCAEDYEIFGDLGR